MTKEKKLKRLSKKLQTLGDEKQCNHIFIAQHRTDKNGILIWRCRCGLIKTAT